MRRCREAAQIVLVHTRRYKCCSAVEFVHTLARRYALQICPELGQLTPKQLEQSLKHVKPIHVLGEGTCTGAAKTVREHT